jgi:hypothetical protein
MFSICVCLFLRRGHIVPVLGPHFLVFSAPSASTKEFLPLIVGDSVVPLLKL